MRLRRVWGGKDLSEGNKRLFRAGGLALAEDEPAATVLHLALLLAACPELATADAHGRLPLHFAAEVRTPSKPTRQPKGEGGARGERGWGGDMGFFAPTLKHPT